MFYNDLNGDRAGVIRFDGKRWQAGKSLRKYNPTNTGEGLLTPTTRTNTPKTPAETPADTPTGEPNPSPPAPNAGPPVGLPNPGSPPPGPGPSPPPLPDRTALLTVRVSGQGSVTAAQPAPIGQPAGTVCGADSTCAWRYPVGTQVRLEMPLANSPGWHFDRVTGCASTGTSGATRTCTLTVSRARTVQAIWARDTRSLTVTIAGTGTGTVSGQGLSCSGRTCRGRYNVGTTVTLRAAPGRRSTFDGWSGCSPAGSRTCSVTLDNNTRVRVTFTRMPDTTPPHVTLSIGGSMGGTDTTVTLRVRATDAESTVTMTGIWLGANGVCRASDGTENPFSFVTPSEDPPTVSSPDGSLTWVLDAQNSCSPGEKIVSADYFIEAAGTSEGGTTRTPEQSVSYAE